MSEIYYSGSAVNRSVNQLTNVSGKFQLVANDVRSKTGVMIGCKGFSHIASSVSSDVYSSVIIECEQKVAGLVGDIRRKQSDILTYSQNQNDIDDFVDSLSVQEYYALKNSGALAGIDKKISGWAKAGFAADNLFSTACTFALGFVEGVGDFVESVGDGVIMVAGSAVSGVADLVGAEDFANNVSEWTRATVAEDVVGNAFNSLYSNTEFGQYLQKNSTFFDEARGLGNGLGYASSVIVASTLFPSVGMVGFAASAGFGSAGERSYADGAELGEGLLYSTASAGWEAAQWAVGLKINGLSIPGVSKLATSALRVGLDGIDSGLEGFVQPGLTMIYKDYPGETFAEQYGAAFTQNGGWGTVWTQAAIGSTMSAFSEAKDIFKNSRKKVDVTDGNSRFRSAEDYVNSGKSSKEVVPELIDAVARGEVTVDEAYDALRKKHDSLDLSEYKDPNKSWHPDIYYNELEEAGQKGRKAFFEGGPYRFTSGSDRFAIDNNVTKGKKFGDTGKSIFKSNLDVSARNVEDVNPYKECVLYKAERKKRKSSILNNLFGSRKSYSAKDERFDFDYDVDLDEFGSSHDFDRGVSYDRIENESTTRSDFEDDWAYEGDTDREVSHRENGSRSARRGIFDGLVSGLRRTDSGSATRPDFGDDEFDFGSGSSTGNDLSYRENGSRSANRGIFDGLVSGLGRTDSRSTTRPDFDDDEFDF